MTLCVEKVEVGGKGAHAIELSGLSLSLLCSLSLSDYEEEVGTDGHCSALFLIDIYP